MRRVLAFVALTGALLVAAGCGDSKDTAGTGTPSNPTSTTAASGGGGDNTTQVCAAAKKAVEDGLQQFTTEIGKAMTAAASGDQTATDQALKTIKDMFTQWASAVRAQSGLATNAELKTALTTFAGELEKASANLNTAADLEKLADLETPEMKSADEVLTRICGE